MIEIGQVVVTTFVTNLGNLLIGFGQKFSCNPNSDAFHIVHKRLIGFLLEIPAKRTRFHAHQRRSIAEINSFLNILENVFVNFIDVFLILVI